METEGTDSTEQFQKPMELFNQKLRGDTTPVGRTWQRSVQYSVQGQCRDRCGV